MAEDKCGKANTVVWPPHHLSDLRIDCPSVCLLLEHELLVRYCCTRPEALLVPGCTIWLKASRCKKWYSYFISNEKQHVISLSHIQSQRQAHHKKKLDHLSVKEKSFRSVSPNFKCVNIHSCFNSGVVKTFSPGPHTTQTKDYNIARPDFDLQQEVWQGNVYFPTNFLKAKKKCYIYIPPKHLNNLLVWRVIICTSGSEFSHHFFSIIDDWLKCCFKLKFLGHLPQQK